jgi:Mg-chelatase subunit ChlD
MVHFKNVAPAQGPPVAIAASPEEPPAPGKPTRGSIVLPSATEGEDVSKRSLAKGISQDIASVQNSWNLFYDDAAGSMTSGHSDFSGRTAGNKASKSSGKPATADDWFAGESMGDLQMPDGPRSDADRFQSRFSLLGPRTPPGTAGPSNGGQSASASDFATLHPKDMQAGTFRYNMDLNRNPAAEPASGVAPAETQAAIDPASGLPAAPEPSLEVRGRASPVERRIQNSGSVQALTDAATVKAEASQKALAQDGALPGQATRRLQFSKADNLIAGGAGGRGEAYGDKAPLLGDMPMAGKLFRSGSAAGAPTASTHPIAPGAVTFGAAVADEITQQHEELLRVTTNSSSLAAETPAYDGLPHYRLGDQLGTPAKKPATLAPETAIVLPQVPSDVALAFAVPKLESEKQGRVEVADGRVAGYGIKQLHDSLSGSFDTERDAAWGYETHGIREPGPVAQAGGERAKKDSDQQRRSLEEINRSKSRVRERKPLSEISKQSEFEKESAFPEVKKPEVDAAQRRPATPAPAPQPEIQTRENPFSTFSLNVSDVSFKLAGASLEKGVMPDANSIRSEEFINAFDYRDPEPPAGVPVGFAWERAAYPFAQNRDLLRFSIKTAAQGRQAGRPLNIVLLLDNSGSMERADRVRIIREALRVLAAQLQAQDKFSVVTFSRTARLWVDGVPGNQAAGAAAQVGSLTPEGGTNLEEAMNLAYQTALRHYLPNGINRVVLLTDGAANLGNLEPEELKKKVESNRKQGIALDCFGIGWEGYNDDLLEVLSRNGDGRYGFVNTPEEAASEFAGQLAGALHVAASDVKVQVEFNPARVAAYRQIGYAKHQLTKEQFRDNTVDAAEIGAAEAGNALYVIEVNPRGDGPLGVVRVRYKLPGTSDYREQEWTVPYTGSAGTLDSAGPALRLAASTSAFSEWLASSPYAAEVTLDRVLGYLSGVPEVYGADGRPKKLEWMIRQAKSIAGK